MAPSSTAAPRQNVRNARYAAPGQPYTCNICQGSFGTTYSLKRHFDNVCFPKHGHPANMCWDDHPSCLVANQALFHPNARPFYPTYQSVTDGVARITWPTLCGWPTDPAELERKNAAHVAIPDSNPHFVDTPGNVFADIREDDEDHVKGESPLLQLKALIQLMTVENVRAMLKLAKDGNWKHGFADDYFLALSLHKSNGEVRDLLGIKDEVRDKWFEQACRNFYTEHVRVRTGPNAAVRLHVGAQEVAWDGLVGAFRLAHRDFSGEARVRGCCRSGVIDDVFAEIEADKGGE